MDTFKYLVLIVTFAALVCVQNNPGAAPGDNCTTGDDTKCTNEGETCDGSICICNQDYYQNEGICSLTDTLKPTIQATLTSTHDSVSLSWISPLATGYSNDYIIKYTSQGGSQQITSALGDVSQTTVNGLTPGTSYTFVVSRSINREGRTQSNIDSTGRDSTTKPATTTGITGTGNTTLNAPDIQIWFHRADGVAQGYSVRLQRDSPDAYDHTVYPTNTGTSIQAMFNNVTAGRTYTLSIITNSYGVTSVPFITTIRVMAELAGKVDQLEAAATSITSRSVYVMWKRPKNPNGNIYQYSLQAINNGKCVQQIILNCTACNRTEMITNERSDTVCDNTVNIVISEEEIENDDYLVSHNVTGLLPDITYTIEASAFNVEGKGVPASLARRTSTEAAGEPTRFESPGQTSSSILLTWTSPVPRPGTTGYTIRVYEREENSHKYELFNTSNIIGYDINSVNVTGLSSYWDYFFTIVAFTVNGSSQLVQLSPVKTRESVPTEIEDLKSSDIKDVYDQIQLSWKCPKQKDGRNGEITFANVNYTTLTTSQTVNLRQGFVRFPVTQDCAWTERLKVTAEFNYTFKVYVSNRGFDGLPTNIVVYIAAGPPSFTNTPAVLLESGETSAVLEICRPCILNNKNGLVVKTGLILCKVGSCPSQLTSGGEDYYDSLPNWNTATGNNFNALLRATSNDWLNDDLSNDAGRFSLGNEECDVGDQNRYCNGPLPVANTFRVWIFACTRAGCTTSNYIDVELRAKDKSFPVSIIAAIVCVTVAVIAIGVIITVYLKIIKPRSKKTNTKYKTTTSPDQKEDTYEEIKGSQRLSVIQDGRQDVDYYNTRGSLPQADNTYDQLAPYFNADQHDYGKINVTQT